MATEQRPALPKRTTGFSLVELGVVLLVLAVIGIGLWRLMPQILDLGDAGVARDLDRIETGVESICPRPWSTACATGPHWA
ncbi:MAG: hypothetical protein LC667_00295 [Thioalkalivibrio sp.]|nr:hypothetical protein [Thioalkalivibrio sp.]